jgi:hypothetical protein
MYLDLQSYNTCYRKEQGYRPKSHQIGSQNRNGYDMLQMKTYFCSSQWVIQPGRAGEMCNKIHLIT